MTIEMQIAVSHLLNQAIRHVPIVASSAATVGGAIAAGWEVAGGVGGLIAGAGGIVGLFLTIATMNRNRRREYAQEVAAAEQRGEARFQRDMEFWRGIALAHLQAHSGPIPIPPSQQDEEIRPV